MSKFAGFQDVPVITLDELTQLGDIELGRGNIISKIDIRENSGSYPIYSSSSKNNGMMGRYGKFMFDEEMVTWSVDGGGKFFYRPRHKFSVTNVSGYMRANQEKFAYKFLHGVLDFQHSFLNFDYQSKAHPSVIRELYEVPIPPLPEQKKIAAILTSVDEVIETTQKQIDKLQDLKKANMNELLTKGIGHTEFKDSELGRIPKSWEVKTLSDVVNPKRPITYGIVQAGPHVEGGIPYIRVSDMNADNLHPKNMLRTSREIVAKFNRSTVTEGDIVYALRGNVGKVMRVPKVLSGANLTQGTALISQSNRIESDFLICAMQSELVQKQTNDMAKGSTFVEMTLGNLKNIKLVLPPVSEQKNIANILSSFSRRNSNLCQKLTQTQSLKKSLMQDLLTGKVRVKVD